MFDPVIQQSFFEIVFLFLRVGTICMFLPGVGDAILPMRIRLTLALTICIGMFLCLPSLPFTLPKTDVQIMLYAISELMIGLSIGVVVKLLASALHTAGTIISLQSGLSSAMIFDPAQSTQSSIFSSFLTIIFTNIVIASNTHLAFIREVCYSYQVIQVAQYIENYLQLSDLFTRLLSDVFLVSIKIAAPCILITLIFNLALGILSKLMPQIQAFFIVLPAQIVLNIAIFNITIGFAMIWFLSWFGDTFFEIFS